MNMVLEPRGNDSVSIRGIATFPLGAVFVALGAAGAGVGLLRCLPDLETRVFVAGAAGLAGLLSGSPTEAGAEGWMVGFAGQPLLVTTMCAATDFFVMAAALLGWHCALRTGRPAWWPIAGLAALVAAVPLTLFVNALRLIAVAQTHRWASPRLPEVYDAFLHLLTGVAVFLPALIALNLALEIYGRSHPSSRA